jgi:Ca2+-binding RTX toxin-like protein
MSLILFENPYLSAPGILPFAIITGTNGPDTLTGTTEADEIFGLAGDDVLRGLEGNDRITPGDGTDFIDGGPGNDTVIYSDSGQGWTIDLQGESATNGIINEALVSIENATGSRQADIIRGTSGNNDLFGGEGNDRLEGRGGNDDLRGGSGNDFLLGGDGVDRFDGGDGVDTVSWEDQPGSIIVDLTVGAAFNGSFTERLFRIENVIGTSGNDSLFGDGFDNVFDGGPDGADYMVGSGGFDTVSYRTSVRSVIIDLDVKASWDGQNRDTFPEFSGAIGSRFDDVIYGSVSTVNRIDGGPSGADLMYGGAARDTLSYASSNTAVILDVSVGLSYDGASQDRFFDFEVFEGSAFNDSIFGSDGDNELYGLAGNDYIFGGAGRDLIFGGDGDDFLIGDFGSDQINGGAGVDTVSYQTSVAGVSVNLGTGTAFDGGATDTLVSIENAIGTPFSDSIVGSNADNLIDGGASGADFLDGGFGADTVTFANAVRALRIDLLGQFADDGVERDTVRNFEIIIGSRFNDIIIGDSIGETIDGGPDGADQLDGGLGVDTVSYASSLRGVIIDLPNNASWDGVHQDTIVNFENATGSAFNDQIFGNALGNVLRGGPGDDYLQGEGGDDVLDGGPGADRFQGGSGNDDFILRKGEAEGDWVQTFFGNGAAPGDRIVLAGWSPLSTMVLIDPVLRTWRITDGADGSTATVRISGDFDPSTDLIFG